MEANWVVIYKSSQLHKAELVKAVLEDNEITAVIIDKQDSSYFFGEIELYVAAEFVIQAKHIISKNNL